MGVQITVRIPDEVAAFVDSQVDAGGASRAAVVTRALRREQRRQRYADEARRLAERPAPTDHELAEEAAHDRWAVDNAAALLRDLD